MIDVKKRPYSTISWVVVNGALSVLLYFATVRGFAPAQNLIKFYIWANFVLALMLFFLVYFMLSKGDWKYLKRDHLLISKNLSFCYGVIWTGVLAYFGWFGYASLNLATTIFQYIYFEDPK